MNYKLGLLIFLFLTMACLPEQPVREPVQSEQNSESTNTNNNTDTETSNETNFGFDIQWSNSGSENDVLTVDVDNKKTIYLYGDKLHDYLLDEENFEATYCIEARFQQTLNTSPKILRVKAVPAISNNIILGTLTRFLRVNLNTDSGNNYCNKNSYENVNGTLSTVTAGDTNRDGSVDGNDNTFVYDTDNVCTDCLNILASNELTLFQYFEDYTTVVNGNSTTISNLNALVPVDTLELDYTKLVLRIDMNSNSNNGGSSCSDTNCQIDGFDCCVDGQCVNEKSLKIAGVTADPTGFAVAEQEKFIDENWFKKYPQFYYICLEQTPSDQTGSDGGDNNEPEDPVGEANDRLIELIADYECVEELKTNSVSDPFHKNPYNSSEAYTKCNVTDSTQTLYYEEVMKRLYINCGCVEKTDLTSMVSNCPAYTYTPTFQTDNNGVESDTIIAISCVTPEPAQTPLPFQDLEVAVSARSAPHRFFDTTNNEIVPGEDLPSGATGTQEGDQFQYLDDFYIFPQNGSFNMNSLLGEFTVNLDKAHPAKIIDVEFDKQYIISTRSGIFSLCPNCAKDSWFNNFSASPTTNRGAGLQNILFSTQRDTYDNNLSLGNYEDTIFGRACWVPPTMIPLGHTENSDTQDQRQNRLQAQAALYVNGYQRDWYGFNKGALIGSFDGVTWFAIGKGRIVKSSSNKLFLAINSPFADLATPTSHIVAVQEYDFLASGPTFDYVPGLEVNDPSQNSGATCQENHQCETDTDCITRLGWEYSCADITYQETKWPSFEALGASEISDTSLTGTIVDFLQQKELPPESTTKKCVYRGAGAPCRVDYANITDEGLRKNLTCAPNFYCARLSNTTAFNDEVARFGRPLDELVEATNHYYGQDANILGRPKTYISTGNLGSLPSEVQSVIEENVLLYDENGAGNIGLCRPGKLLPSYNTISTTTNWEQTNQHQAADADFRTDYISQIAGCNSTLYTDLRYSSCPMLDEDGNYIHTQDDFLNDNFLFPDSSTPQSMQAVTERYTAAQNACGLESLDSTATITTSTTADSLSDLSAFKTIEGLTMGTSQNIIEPTLARDACFRKAGAVCHTDLDCSPNKMMADVVDLVPASYFGNQAEKTYFEEYLVCGQAQSKPLTVDDPEFNDYNMSNNKCCRPIGESITMYTEDSPDVPESQGLRTDTFGAYNPNDPSRYSRYSVSDSPVNAATKRSSLTRPSANADDVDLNKNLDNIVNITNTRQWETIHDTAAKLCCGGSWVRKFADGTNNWTINRLNLDVSDFQCLNLRSSLYLTDEASEYNLSDTDLNKDRPNFCGDPRVATSSSETKAGCVSVQHGALDDFVTRRPVLDTTTSRMTIDSDATIMNDLWDDNLWAFSYLRPMSGETVDPEIGYVMDWTDSDPAQANINLTTIIPAFITYDNVNDLVIELEDPTNPGTYNTCAEITPANGVYGCNNNPSDPQDNGGICGDNDQWNANRCAVAGGGAQCCYLYNTNTRALTIAPLNGVSGNAANFGDDDNIFSMRITYSAVGTLQWESEKNAAFSVDDTTTSVLAHRRSAEPGNALYYLTKLSKLEYLGIPQMTYEPIYCNDNYQKLMPGVFKEVAFGQQLQTVVDFINHSKTFRDSSVSDPFASDSAPAPYNANAINDNLVGTQELIDHPAIFSDNQFMCCLELGMEADNPTQCCSGFGVENDSDGANDDEITYTCKLPAGTNLNVYFNKFVSGEGISDRFTDTVLEGSDFNARTGEPELNEQVFQKLLDLGEDFCEGGVTRRGGSYGFYAAMPRGPVRVETDSFDDSLFQILDQNFENGVSNNINTGWIFFNEGIRWNHQVYCDFADN